MSNMIFTRLVMKKHEIYNRLIAYLEGKGWEILNKQHASFADSAVLHSKGDDGTKPMYICIYPYSGYNGVGNANYDTRVPEVLNSNLQYIAGTGYDVATGKILGNRLSPSNNSKTLAFFSGNRDDLYSTAPFVEGLTEIELYIYADKQRFAFLCVPPLHTGLGNTLTYFGEPEISYLKERKLPDFSMYSGIVQISTGRNIAGINKVAVMEKPLRTVPSSLHINADTLSLLSPYSPNVDKVFQLSDIYIGTNNEGLRFKLGTGIYALPNTGAADGDIIEVEEGGSLKRYRFCTVAHASNDTFLNGAAFAIRV